MKMLEARKGLRVRLTPEVAERHRNAFQQRELGTLTSGRVVALKRPYEEGLVVRVKWDGFKTPENWHLTDLVAASPDTGESTDNA